MRACAPVREATRLAAHTSSIACKLLFASCTQRRSGRQQYSSEYLADGLAAAAASLSTDSCMQVYLASAAPPVRYPNVYGVDMPTRREFVAYNLTEPQICEVQLLPLVSTCQQLTDAIVPLEPQAGVKSPFAQVLGADGLLYQSIDDLVAVGRELNPGITNFDTSCFTGACGYACRSFLHQLQR